MLHRKRQAIVCALLLTFIGASFAQESTELGPGVRKVKDIVIYQDSMFYAAFPSIIRTGRGDLLLAFRRAPNRQIFGEESTNHTDANSYLVMLRSDDGENWPSEPVLLHAHPFGGSQDPCLLKLSDGTILCTSYGWAFVRPEGRANLKEPFFEVGHGAIFLGGYTLRSADHGMTWQGPSYPPHIEPEIHFNAHGNPVPAYNRGALYQNAEGRIYWIVAAHDQKTKTSNHLLTSNDQGETWSYVSEVARDSLISFNEASILETPGGDLVGFLRTANYDDAACIARSVDNGKTFTWQSMGFQGHPLNALRLRDGRVLLTYGYRHAPYGIRGRILNSECTDFEDSQEFVLRNDGGNRDLGYPWPVLLEGNRVLVVYYFNRADGLRHIAGTILEIE